MLQSHFFFFFSDSHFHSWSITEILHKSTARHFTDPEQFEEYLLPAAGVKRVRPMVGSRFRATLDTQVSQRVRMLKVDTDSYCVGDNYSGDK